MPLSPTTLETLEDTIREQIRSTTPRLTVQGAEAWKPYTKHAGSAARTRRFRLVWEEGNFVVGGIFTPDAVEVQSLLRVRTDYVGEHDELQKLRQNDLHQLRDRIHALANTDSNGMILVDPSGVRVERPPDWDTADAGQWDLVYPIRYLIARG
jgi:hypothetical protein